MSVAEIPHFAGKKVTQGGPLTPPIYLVVNPAALYYKNDQTRWLDEIPSFASTRMIRKIA
jgi:hypothetical protein